MEVWERDFGYSTRINQRDTSLAQRLRPWTSCLGCGCTLWEEDQARQDHGRQGKRGGPFLQACATKVGLL